ncbi:NAD(P)/FAD-dependent oxidoreductase [Candidatus Izemoplasma sp. B36]|uniref:NAD(P)/FAD-dependent oxidoreductase n=1 Tax=Candidatus Izemoplasma sp. B36 TaxID=3242468 RepID=UPI003557A4FC
MYDYVVIGAGIVGSFIARELSKYDLKALVVEKENDVANVQTLANSAILHSGHNPKPNTLKSRLCLLGNKMYNDVEKELNIQILRSGAFVVAHGESEEKQLAELVETTKQNNVTEYELLSYEEAVKTEPNLAKSVTQVLSLPTTGVIYPWEVAFACMENAIVNGVEFRKNAEVTNLIKDSGTFKITINDKDIVESKYVINATGVNTDDIAEMLEKHVDFKITPRKGEYFVLDKRVKGFVNHVLYPLPTNKGKGVLLTPQVHGNILVGPDSKFVDDKYRTDNTNSGLGYVKENASLLADNIPFNQIIRSFAGIRATSTKEDFIIEESKEIKGLYHTAGIDSPGLTAAPAIAEYLVNEIMMVQDKYDTSKDFDPIRKKLPEFHSLPEEKQRELIKQDSRYANIICKCEKITEKEIVDAINGPLGSNSIKGIKKRTRAGAGLCQGGYCEEKVYKLIARETNSSPLDIVYDSQKSNLFVSETKVKK